MRSRFLRRRRAINQYKACLQRYPLLALRTTSRTFRGSAFKSDHHLERALGNEKTGCHLTSKVLISHFTNKPNIDGALGVQLTLIMAS
jgi:hypothetical protein